MVRERDGTRVICTEERLNADNQSASDLLLFTDFELLFPTTCQGGRIGLIWVSRSHTRPMPLLSVLSSPSMPAPWGPCWSLLTIIPHNPGPIKHQAFSPICILVLHFPFSLGSGNLSHFLLSHLESLHSSPLLYRPDWPAPLLLDTVAWSFTCMKKPVTLCYFIPAVLCLWQNHSFSICPVLGSKNYYIAKISL